MLSVIEAIVIDQEKIEERYKNI